MWRISKEFHFSASHQLTHLPPEHPCARLHGHNYVATVCLAGSPAMATGFVLDYRDLDAFKRYVDDELDHRHLNEQLGSAQATTAEHLARHLYRVADRLFRGVRIESVRVSETPKTWAEYAPGNENDAFEAIPGLGGYVRPAE